jgi:translocation and assembly module TamA
MKGHVCAHRDPRRVSPGLRSGSQGARARVLALSLALLAVVAASPAEAQPAELETVHAVVIRGNEHVSDSDILERLATHPPEGVITVTRYEYDPIVVAADRERIERLYRERGFFSARVTDVHVIDLGAGRVGVRFDVIEGEPTLIERRQILGLPEDFEPTPRLELALSRLEQGDVFRHDAYLQVRQQLGGALRERGHAHAAVTGAVRVDRERARAIVTLSAQPGPRVRYGDVEVTGLDWLPESVVRNRVAWQRGEVFSPAKMEATQGRLYELGYFSSVRLDYPSRGQPEVIDVEIRAVEGARREVQLGGGLAFDDAFFEVRARAGYLVRGFYDPLLSLRLSARPAYQILRVDPGFGSLGGEASVSLDRIDLLLPRARGTAQLAARRTELEAYDARGGITRLTWGVPVADDRIELRVGWEFRPFFELLNLHPAFANPANADIVDAIGATVSPYRLGTFDQSVILDLRDSILAPTRGLFASLRLEQGGAFAGGREELTYTTGTAELRGYVPIGERLVVTARGRLGAELAGDVPLTQRYYAGGAASHRGFGHRRLSPTIAVRTPATFEGDPFARIGGGALFESSYELRTRLTRIGDEWLGLTFFADGGDVSLELGDLELGSLYWAVGAGLRYNTIIGPVRFDVGYRITDLDQVGGPVEGNRLVFHFSLGEAF